MSQRLKPPFRGDMVGSLLRSAPVKDARAKAAAIPAAVAGAANRTSALSVPRLTWALSTPSTAPKTRSARATHEAQLMPSS